MTQGDSNPQPSVPKTDALSNWKHPQRRAGDLAPKVDRELRVFKADVRKLKGLGLTRSFEVGYELTPLGRQVLKALRRS